MRTFVLSFFLAVFSLTMVATDVSAAKFGGGSKLGKLYSAPKAKPATAPQQKQATTPTKQSTAANTSKRSGFGGLMAGLLAGGLLGALFFGGGFDGIQFMDILLMAGVAFIAFKLFKAFKKSQSQPSYAAPGGYSQPAPEVEPVVETAQYKQEKPVFGHAEPTSAPASSAGLMGQALSVPAWFNKDAFVDGAREHYVTLQRAWDLADWSEIQSYTTPELFELLKVERAKLPEQQHTEVVSVMAELVDFIDNQDHVVVTMSFYGWIKEDGENTVEFNELWHLRKEMKSADDTSSSWYIEGIQPQ